MMKLVCAALMCAPLVFAPTHSAAATPIHVMLLDGQSAGTYHDWKATTPVLKKELEDAGLFQVTVVTSPESGGDFSNFKPEFSKYQVVVSNLDSPDWPAELKTQLEQFVKNGGGLVVVHGADNAFPDWLAYNQMIGIGGWRNRTEKAGPMWYYQDGKQVSDPSPGNAGMHGERRPFQVVTRAADHPIMKGLPPAWMHFSDELYGTLRGPGENMTILATAHSDPNNKGTGHEEPMLLAVKFGKGRVFHTTMGHDVAALSCVGFMTTFQRGTEWAATGKVSQKLPATFPTADTVSYRTDLAAMAPAPAKSFDALADEALDAMRKRAAELNIGGVAVVAYFQGDKIQAWSSKMAVVGRMRDDPTAQSKGSNLLGIAYAKASEMADTLKDSGSNVRPPMTGEFGWQGGVIVRGKAGYLVAAFSGGKSEDDVQVSRAGVEKLKGGL